MKALVIMHYVHDGVAEKQTLIAEASKGGRITHGPSSCAQAYYVKQIIPLTNSGGKWNGEFLTLRRRPVLRVPDWKKPQQTPARSSPV